MTYLEALDYAKSRKVVLPNEYYNEFTAAQRSTATTVAGLASLDQIKAVIDQVHEALANGKTFKQFQDSVDQLKLGLPKGRLDNIFRTNIQVAYAQGRYKQQQRSASNRPYLLYSAVNDSRTRPSHLAKNGTLLHRDHPWWLTNTPPCGYRCRCTVISLTQAQAEKRGISAAPPEAVSNEGWDFHPSEYEGVLAKAEANKLGALELLTKQASAQQSNYVATAQDIKQANATLHQVRKAIFNTNPIEQAERLARLKQVMQNFKAETGQELPLLDAALVTGYTYEGYKALTDIRKAATLTAWQSIVQRHVEASFIKIERAFKNTGSVLWRGVALDDEGLSGFNAKFHEGAVIEWGGITSTSIVKNEALNFTGYKKEPAAKVLLQMVGMAGTGLDVAAAGLRKDQAEVILLEKTKIRILKVNSTTDENGLILFVVYAQLEPKISPITGRFSVI